MINYEFCKSHSNQRKQNKTTLPLIGAGGPTRQRNKRERGGSPALPRTHARAVAVARLGGGAAPARRRRPASGAAWPGRGQGGPAGVAPLRRPGHWPRARAKQRKRGELGSLMGGARLSAPLLCFLFTYFRLKVLNCLINHRTMRKMPNKFC